MSQQYQDLSWVVVNDGGERDPVDAIVGAASQMHTIIESHCTGCELCLPPCPVDCITMEPVADTVRTWRWPQPDTADAVQEAA